MPTLLLSTQPAGNVFSNGCIMTAQVMACTIDELQCRFPTNRAEVQTQLVRRAEFILGSTDEE